MGGSARDGEELLTCAAEILTFLDRSARFNHKLPRTKWTSFSLRILTWHRWPTDHSPYPPNYPNSLSRIISHHQARRQR